MQPRHVLLCVILLVLGFYKWPLAADYYHTGIDKAYDGGYYTNVAQNVRDGRGFVTDVSLFHKGYSYFPHPTSIYPVWPAVFGFTSRFVPIEIAAVRLPTALYFIALVFAYLWGRTVCPRELFPSRLPGFNAGHLIVLIFGLHKTFFYYSSGPYTEAISYAILFAGLWATHRVWRRPSWWGGLAIGVWLGLAMLARSQLFLAAIAALLTLLWASVAVVPRRRYLSATVAAVTGFVFLVGFHYWYLRGFIVDPSLGSLLRFDQNRAEDLLTPVKVIAKKESLAGYLKDRGKGFLVAFALNGQYAYSRSFYLFGYALACALPFLLLECVRSASVRGIRAGWLWMRRRSSLPWLFYVAFAIGGFLSLHVLHKTYYAEWNFGLRQGLTAGLLFFFALLYLLSRRYVPAAALGILILCASVYSGCREIRAQAEKAEEREPPSQPYKAKLAKWLMRRRTQGKQLIVGMDGPHKMAPYTPGVGYHAVIRGKTTVVDMQKMVSELGVRYFLLRDHGGYRAQRSPRFKALFRRISGRMNGYHVYQPSPALLERRNHSARTLHPERRMKRLTNRPW